MTPSAQIGAAPLLDVRDLRVAFRTPDGVLEASAVCRSPLLAARCSASSANLDPARASPRRRWWG